MQLIPGANVEQVRALNELMQLSTSTETALRIYQAFNTLDVRGEARQVRCPTLVMHATGDLRVPFEDGRLMASLIPDAHFVPLESKNHLLLKSEPALAKFFGAIDQFIRPAGTGPALTGLTKRELDVLEYVAQGLSNAQIAARLSLAEKTVRNYLVVILDKLHLESRTQAVVHAREAGFGRNTA
jgi:DNA-binding CsgD family transcriptional regulator